MKHTKLMSIPAKTREVIDKVTCDLCGNEIETVGYDCENITVSHRVGTMYPEGGGGVETVVDMCGSCFDSKLVPWLKTQGADPKPTDWDI